MPRAPNPTPRQLPIVGKSSRRTRASENTDAVKPVALPLPHERDQTTRKKAHPATEVMDQAQKDVQGGLQDTDLRGRAAEVFDRRWGRNRKTKT